MMHIMEHVLEHALEDTIKLLPFLFLTYLAMEYIEEKGSEKTYRLLHGNGKRGPVIGGLLGIIPQCGFAAISASLYAGGVITVGTMVAVLLSTSDEMLPLLISGRAATKDILFIIIMKVLIGICAGICVDIFVRKINYGKQKGLHIYEICERDHCHCEEGSLVKAALIHCVKIAGFIFVFSVVTGLIVEIVGADTIMASASKYQMLSIVLVALVGLIPNCATSVAITTFYLEGIISIGSMFAGLLSCSGMGLVVLFRTNRNWKKNVQILTGLYIISILGGIFMEIMI